MSSDLLLVSEVREGVEVECHIINGEVVLPGIILKCARQETCHKRIQHISLHICHERHNICVRILQFEISEDE